MASAGDKVVPFEMITVTDRDRVVLSEHLGDVERLVVAPGNLHAAFQNHVYLGL